MMMMMMIDSFWRSGPHGWNDKSSGPNPFRGQSGSYKRTNIRSTVVLETIGLLNGLWLHTMIIILEMKRQMSLPHRGFLYLVQDQVEEPTKNTSRISPKLQRNENYIQSLSRYSFRTLRMTTRQTILCCAKEESVSQENPYCKRKTCSRSKKKP